jgi:hypothetical protein
MLTSLTAAQTRAAHGRAATDVVGLHHGHIAATEQLRFSQSYTHATRYLEMGARPVS